MAALRTERDRAMVQAMLLGGLRRCEVLGLRLEDLRLGEWRVFVAEGKGGHQRLVPVSQTFFATVAPLSRHRTSSGCVDGPRVRGVEGSAAWTRVVERGTGRVLSKRASGPISCTGRVTSCVTRASRGCVRVAWRSRRCRPRPVTGRSRRRASICISAPTGSPTNTSEQPKRSKPKRRSEQSDERAKRRLRSHAAPTGGVSRRSCSRGRKCSSERPAWRRRWLAISTSSRCRHGRRPLTPMTTRCGCSLGTSPPSMPPAVRCRRSSIVTSRHTSSGWPAGPDARTRVSAATISHRLCLLRTFFERIIDWDYDDAPKRSPIYAGDFPERDEPLPKFLDDPTAAKFMATLATDPNKRRRLHGRAARPHRHAFR